MTSRRLAALIALLLIGVGCSDSAVEDVRAPDAFRVHAKIPASDLPPRLLEEYRFQMTAPEPPGGHYYRIGDLNTILLVFETPFGKVFADGGGGGMAWSESCRAMDAFEVRNGWRYGAACLDGTREDSPE